MPAGSTDDNYAFYRTRAETACALASAKMTSAWTANKNPNNTVFVRDTRTDCAVQGDVQDDDYQYEVSFYYAMTDVFVTFHCYPAR